MAQDTVVPEIGPKPEEGEGITDHSRPTAQNKSFVLQEPGKVSYEDRPVPQLKDPNDVIVEVKYTGICGSDVRSRSIRKPGADRPPQVHYWTSGRIGSFVVTAPMVLGHESAGVVHAVGASVRALRPGDAVALEPGAPCRRCPRCREGRYNLCVDMVFAATPPHDGTLARYYVLPADFCHPLPRGAPLAHGALMEPAAVAVHVCRQAGVGAGTASVVVFGAGPIGLLCCAVARAFGAAAVVCVDVNEERARFAERYAGARVFRPAKEKTPEENGAALVEECGLGLGADAVIDATGAAVCVQTGIWALRTGGTYCQAGMVRILSSRRVSKTLNTSRGLPTYRSPSWPSAPRRSR
jgi:D-xylulose reductase